MKPNTQLAADHLKQHGMFSPTVFTKESELNLTAAAEALKELAGLYSLSKKKVVVRGCTYTVSFVTKPTAAELSKYTALIEAATRKVHPGLDADVNEAFKRAWV